MFLPLPTLNKLLFFDAKNHSSTAFHTKFSRSTHLVLRRKLMSKTMLYSAQISSGSTYWEYTSESDYILVLRDQLPKTVSLEALSKLKSLC